MKVTNLHHTPSIKHIRHTESVKLGTAFFGKYLNTLYPHQNSTVHSVLIYGIAGAAGFASFENFLYLVKASSENVTAAFVTAFARTFFSVPLHCSTGALMGADLALSGQNQHKPISNILVVPVLIHGTYDFFLEMAARVFSRLAFLICFLIAVSMVALSIDLARKKRNSVIEENQKRILLPL